MLCVGPEKATDAIRKALQMGADKGVHVVDDAIAGSDALATSLVLAAASRRSATWRPGGLRHGLDRRLDVRRPGDAGRAARPPAGDPRLARSRVEGDQFRIRRDGDTATEVIGATAPLVLSVTDQSGEARYPSFKGIMAAKKKPLETWSLADLGVDAGRGRPRRPPGPGSRTPRPARRAPPGEIVTDEDGTAPTALVEFLASKKFI